MKFNLRDAFAGSGLLLVAVGAGAIYWPMALIVSGIVLLGLALWRVRDGTD